MRRRQRGVALITALLVVALATTAAVAMVSRQQIDIRRTANVLEHDQALLYVEGIEGWAGKILQRDRKDSQTDHLEEEWAMVLPPIPVDGGQLLGSLEDLQGRFNLNSLLDANGQPDPVQVDRFRLLLMVLGLDPEIATVALDWIDADVDVRVGGAEDGEYLGLEHPYRAANRPFASPSELRLLIGVSAEIYNTLAPYVTALPRTAALNVNTIPMERPELVMMLASNIDRAQAVQALETRVGGFNSVQEFLNQLPPGSKAAAQGLSVSSGYFMVTSQVQFGRSTFTTYSVLRRDKSGACLTVARAQGIY